MKRITSIAALLVACVCLLLCTEGRAAAQQFAVSTDLSKWAWLGTINASFSYAPSRHWTIGVQGDCNPWTFKRADKGGRLMREREYGLAAQARYWPWNSYCGWWVGGGLRWESYARGGMTHYTTYKGEAYGLEVSAGFSLMVHSNINIDFGIGAWGGRTIEEVYLTPKCTPGTGTPRRRWFAAPNEASVSLVYTF